MSQETGKNEQRINIPFLEGVNSLVGSNIAKKTELVHAENARSKTIGSIEKREGQTVLGTDINGNTFITTANYGLFSFQDGAGQGFYRISETIDPSSPSASVSPSASISPSASVSPSASLSQSPSASASPSASVSPSSSSSLSQSPSASISPSASSSQSPSASASPSSSYSPSASVSPSPQAEFATIYYLDNNNKWTPLTGKGTSIDGAVFDYTYAENSVFLVNYDDKNRYIQADGVTVLDSTSAGGHLFNTPNASRINFYKDRLYLADYINQGVRYKTSILQSSFPMGIIALVNEDVSAAALDADARTIPITENKYFYTDSGANTYDVYRGNTFITKLTVSAITEVSVTATSADSGGSANATTPLLASDEIWISGTYNGSKILRWPSNPTTSGQNVQQYDTFKLSGGENDPITMMTNIGNVMLISNKNTMASWNDYTLQNFDLDIGCVSKKGYTKILGTLYFLHYTGVYATSGDVPRLMSNKIEKYITGATKTGKEQCAAGKKGRNIFFTLGDVTLYKPDGSVDRVLSDVCIEYNLTQENWFIHTNVKASEFATFIETSDSDRLEFTDTSGNFAVKEFLSGSTDDGTEIPFRIDTNFLTMQPTKIEATSKPVALIVESERGAGMAAYVNLGDNEGYYPLEGSVRKGLSVLKINNKDEGRSKPPTARVISVSLRDSSKQLCKVSRMSIVHLPTNEEVANNQ